MKNFYDYLGYEYRPWEEVTDDNIKIFHECFKDGKRINMPNAFYQHTPYEYMTFAEFCNHIQSVEVFVQG